MPRTRRNGRIALAAGATSLAAVAAVSWWAVASQAGSPSEPTHPVPKAFVRTFETYPTVSDHEAIDETLAGMPSKDFLSVSLQDPDPGSGPQWGKWFHSTMSIDSSDPHDSLFAGWESDVVEGAIAERTSGDAVDLAQVVSNAMSSGRLVDGTIVDLDGGMGDVIPGQEFSAQTDQSTDQEIIANVNSTLFQFGLHPESVQVLRPLGPVIAVRASVDDVKAISGQFYTIEKALLGQPLQYEGIYFELDSSEGKPLVRVAESYRTGSNAVSIADEDAASTLGIVTFGVQPGMNNGPRPNHKHHAH